MRVTQNGLGEPRKDPPRGVEGRKVVFLRRIDHADFVEEVPAAAIPRFPRVVSSFRSHRCIAGVVVGIGVLF